MAARRSARLRLADILRWTGDSQRSPPDSPAATPAKAPASAAPSSLLLLRRSKLGAGRVLPSAALLREVREKRLVSAPLLSWEK